MLGKILHIDITETTQSTVHGDEREIDTLYFHTLHQLTAEMQSRSRYRYSPFILREDCLEAFLILRFSRLPGSVPAS